ncbi:MAG: class I SAM-dependent rRNA methyltransferase [Planctomycetota bacterium]|nr:MAG: class I SAM-dependent rRNA methyltransferase [Planctomycetota bacterium]
MGKIKLTGKGRRWQLTGHPWVYVDDILEGQGEAGELLPVEDPNGNPMGWGLFSTSSRIAVRMVTRSPEQPNREFWLGRMRRAVEARASAGLLDPEGACRLLAGDSDGVPGMVIDRYGRTCVLQSGSQGSDRMRDFLVELLLEVLPFEPDAIVDRSDTSVRRLENLEKRVETLRGSVAGPIVVREGEVEYEVDVFGGHKTGAYLDQRLNRIHAARFAEGHKVLDAFAYDGLFALHAAKAGAESVVCLEQNKAACERLQRAAERNGVADRIEVHRTNCMNALRERAEQGERYGLIILDPPAFARNRKEVAGAERGYVELNRRGFALATEAGHVVSASCSHNVRPHEFTEFLASAARLAGRDVWLEELAGAAPDHPYLVTLPESHYLKCAFLRIG